MQNTLHLIMFRNGCFTYYIEIGFPRNLSSQKHLKYYRDLSSRSVVCKLYSAVLNKRQLDIWKRNIYHQKSRTASSRISSVKIIFSFALILNRSTDRHFLRPQWIPKSNWFCRQKWSEALSCGINGKFYNPVESILSNIATCVKLPWCVNWLVFGANRSTAGWF